jgi:SAM-dependent methyltransferase
MNYGAEYDYYGNMLEVSVPWETGTPRKFLERLIESGLIKPGKVLDLCSITGNNALFLVEHGFEVSGIDLIPITMEHMEDPRTEYLKLPFVEDKFDFVMDLGCFLYLPPAERKFFIKQVANLLSRGGKYLIMLSNYKNDPSWNPFSDRSLVHYFSEDFKIKFIKHMPESQLDGTPQYYYALFLEKK